ncbi:MAG: ATP-binding protein [Bacteroidales bacterium]
MKINSCITTLLLLFLKVSGFSQQSYPDSLKQALYSSLSDSARFTIATTLLIYYQEENRDSALYYADFALSIAKKNNHTLDEANALDNKGYILMHQKNFPESFQNLQQALSIAERPENEGKTWNPSEHSLKTKTRLFILANIHHDLGHLIGRTGDINKQIVHYKKAWRLAEEAGDVNLLGYGSFSLLGLVSMNLGSVFMNLNKLDSALTMTENAVLIFDTSDFMQYQAIAKLNLGEIYYRKGEKQLAYQNYFDAANIGMEQNNLYAASMGYSALAMYFLDEKQEDSSLYYAYLAEDVVTSMKSKNYGYVYEILYRAYELKGNIDSAFKYQGLAMTFKDSTFQSTITSLSDFQRLTLNEQIRLQNLEKERLETQGKIRTYSLLAGLFLILLVAGGLYRQSRQKQKANKILQNAYTKLQATQSQLIHSEKLASLGELTAGIAHEIQNPLNFVNNFSEVNRELIAELKEEIEKGDLEEIKAIAGDLEQNEEKISHHGKRADGIVKSMLQHSRSSSGQKEPTDINALADEYLRLAYHGLRAKDKSFNADFKLEADENLPKVNAVPQDIGRVLLNLINNAFHAVQERNLSGFGNLTGLSDQENYKPTVIVSTKNLGDQIEIRVKDNGGGIPEEIKDKIFQPFFTTKPTGEGTGLGLSLSYDIIKAHNGEVKVISNLGTGTEFIMNLPVMNEIHKQK